MKHPRLHALGIPVPHTKTAAPWDDDKSGWGPALATGAGLATLGGAAYLGRGKLKGLLGKASKNAPAPAPKTNKATSAAPVDTKGPAPATQKTPQAPAEVGPAPQVPIIPQAPIVIGPDHPGANLPPLTLRSIPRQDVPAPRSSEIFRTQPMQVPAQYQSRPAPSAPSSPERAVSTQAGPPSSDWMNAYDGLTPDQVYNMMQAGLL